MNSDNLRARCETLVPHLFREGVSVYGNAYPAAIDTLVQLYHDGYRAGLEEAAKFADEVGDYETMDWCRTRAPELKNESDHG